VDFGLSRAGIYYSWTCICQSLRVVVLYKISLYDLELLTICLFLKVSVVIGIAHL
jgi:hypothetical protein